jgi:hypothetical protein
MSRGGGRGRSVKEGEKDDEKELQSERLGHGTHRTSLGHSASAAHA